MYQCSVQMRRTNARNSVIFLDQMPSDAASVVFPPKLNAWSPYYLLNANMNVFFAITLYAKFRLAGISNLLTDQSYNIIRHVIMSHAIKRSIGLSRIGGLRKILFLLQRAPRDGLAQFTRLQVIGSGRILSRRR